MKNTNQSLCRYIVFICVVVVLVAYAQSVYADEPCPTPNTATSSLKITKMPQGAMPGFFSVAADRKVVFAQGNLQWQGSTNTWRFADEQYEVIGTGTGSPNMVYDTTLRKTSEDWIDLFPWASSGYGKAKPYFVHKEPSSDYYIDGAMNKSMTGAYANYDWGVYNPISNGGNAAGLWRTLTQDEFNYLLNTRPRHDSLVTIGGVQKLDGSYVYGVFFFPDNFVFPNDFPMKFYKYENVSSGTPNNKLTNEQWKIYESLGVVFLPNGGTAEPNQYGNAFTSSKLYIRYWLSTCYTCCDYAYIIYAYYLDGSNSFYSLSANTGYRYNHNSIRLVKTLEPPTVE